MLSIMDYKCADQYGRKAPWDITGTVQIIILVDPDGIFKVTERIICYIISYPLAVVQQLEASVD